MEKRNIFQVVLFFFLIAFFFSLVNAQGEWEQYGGDVNYMINVQTELNSIFNDYNVTLITSSYIQQQYKFPTEPLITDFGILDSRYAVVYDGSYLDVLNGNDLSLNTNRYLGMVGSQLAVYDLDDDNYKEIYGVFANSTSFYVMGFKYNSTLLTIDNFYVQGIGLSNTSLVYSSGVRCFAGNCYSLLFNNTNGSNYDVFLFKFNLSGYSLSKVNYVFSNHSSSPSFDIFSPVSMVDYDNDGNLDFLAFDNANVIVFSENGNVEFSVSNYTGGNVRNARFIDGDSSPYYKLVILSDGYTSSFCGGQEACSVLEVYDLNTGLPFCRQNMLQNSENGIGRDYETYGLAVYPFQVGDFDDIWIVSSSVNSQNIYLMIYQIDCSYIYSTTLISDGSLFTKYHFDLQVGNFDLNDTYPEFVLYDSNRFRVHSPHLSSDYYVSSAFGYSNSACSVGDLTYSGYLDVLCSDGSNLYLYTANYTNQNAQITSVVFSPSVNISVGSTLTITINAYDDEGNPIYYSYKCSDGNSWSSDDTSNVKTCFYNFVGSYNVSVRVRDEYHPTEYNTFSQLINVYEGGGSNQSQGGNQSTGGINVSGYETTSLPLELVNEDNIDEGLLPTIYYGTLGFFSYTLKPFILIMALIFSVLILLAFAEIIKKIAEKVV